jgi:hypothetical protein
MQNLSSFASEVLRGLYGVGCACCGEALNFFKNKLIIL